MLRFHLTILIPMIFIFPYTTSAFFLQNIFNITVPRNISCYVTNDSTLNGYQLCAIRVYQLRTGTEQLTYTTYNGLRYMNTLRRLTGNGCSNLFTISPAGTGAWVCDVPLPFETYSSMEVCVCATDNCNQNYTICRSSAEISTNLTGVVDVMPNITSIVSCNDTSNGTDTCNIHPFINVSSCLDYVRSNGVLCTITVNGTSTTRRSLIGEMYESYLAEKIYNAKFNTATSSSYRFNETQVNFYLTYQAPTDTTNYEECHCTSSMCNQNISTCISQIEITSTTITSSTTTSSATTTSSTSSTASSSSSTSSSSTTSTSSTSSSSSTSTTSKTSTTTTQTTITTTSAANSVGTGGEKGLGSAATAGLVCGIIFSVLIFTGEIIFFKFFYSNGGLSGLNRSEAYRASSN